MGAGAGWRHRRGGILVLGPRPAALPALPELGAPRGPGLVPLPALWPPVPPERPGAALSQGAVEGWLRAGVGEIRSCRVKCGPHVPWWSPAATGHARASRVVEPPPPGAASPRRPARACRAILSACISSALAGARRTAGAPSARRAPRSAQGDRAGSRRARARRRPSGSSRACPPRRTRRRAS